MAAEFTPEEQALIDKWVADSDKDTARLTSSRTIAETALAETQIEDAIYVKMKQEALDELDALLEAKAVALETADPGYDRSVEYLGGHPQNGGTNPTAWQIMRDGELGPEVEYSHSVAWDSNASILAAEAKWSLFQDWRTNDFYGTLVRINGLDGAVVNLTAQLAALAARNAEFM